VCVCVCDILPLVCVGVCGRGCASTFVRLTFDIVTFQPCVCPHFSLF